MKIFLQTPHTACYGFLNAFFTYLILVKNYGIWILILTFAASKSSRNPCSFLCFFTSNFP